MEYLLLADHHAPGLPSQWFLWETIDPYAHSGASFVRVVSPREVTQTQRFISDAIHARDPPWEQVASQPPKACRGITDVQCVWTRVFPQRCTLLVLARVVHTPLGLEWRGIFVLTLFQDLARTLSEADPC